MRLFNAFTDSTKYAPAILKIISSLALIAVVLIFGFKITIENQVLNVIVAFIRVCVLFALVLCLYCAIASLIHISENREKNFLVKKPPSVSECVEMTLEDIRTLIEKNDVVDIVLIANSSVVFAGASSKEQNSSSSLYDKRYYINETVFNDVYAFLLALYSLESKDVVWVYSIDGIKTRVSNSA